MIDSLSIKKIKDKIKKEEQLLEKLMPETEKIWENTGLDSRDPTYLVEKTMRFEMAEKNISKIFSLFRETLNDYKNLCSEIEKSEEL